MGFGTILLEKPPFAHVIPKGCLPGPREKVGKEKKKKQKKQSWLLFSEAFQQLCFSWHQSSGKKRLIKLHKECRRRKVPRLSTPFPWNPKLGIILAWTSPKNVEKGKSPRTCRVSKSIQNLVTHHLHRDRPALTPASLFWVVTIILNRSSGSTPAHQHTVFKTAAERCWYNFKIQRKGRGLTTVYKVLYEPDLAIVLLHLQLGSPCSLC